MNGELPGLLVASMLTCFLESRKNMRGRKKGEEKRAEERAILPWSLELGPHPSHSAIYTCVEGRKG